LKQKCTVQKRREITISEHYELLKRAREYNKTDDFKKNMKKELISDQRNEKIP